MKTRINVVNINSDFIVSSSAWCYFGQRLRYPDHEDRIFNRVISDMFIVPTENHYFRIPMRQAHQWKSK